MRQSRRRVSTSEETPTTSTPARGRAGARSRREAPKEETSNRFSRRPSRATASQSDGEEKEDFTDDTVQREMRSGWSAVQERKERNEALDEARKKELQEFYLQTDEEAEIQLLVDEPIVVEGHNIKNRYGRFQFEPCQKFTQKHCLMCQEGIKLSWKAAFKILDFRGSWDKDKKEFKYDKPVEKIWLTSPTLAAQLNAFFEKRKSKPSELSLLITAAGSGKSKTHNIQLALDEDDRMVPTEKGYVEQKATLLEALQPKDDTALEAMGFEAPQY